MEMVLDCSSKTAAFKSISNLLATDIDNLFEIFRNIGQIPLAETPEHYIPGKVFSRLTPLEFPIKSYWFHATRVINPDRFWKEGIHTKSKIYDELFRLLSDLVKTHELKLEGIYPNNISVFAKAEMNDEGPYAFLFRSLAIEAPPGTHSYINVPEIVEDIAGLLLGANYFKLVTIFEDLSIPCVVTFEAIADDWAINHAIYYAYLIYSGCNELDAADAACWCFSGEGLSIPPSDIVNVEVL